VAAGGLDTGVNVTIHGDEEPTVFDRLVVACALDDIVRTLDATEEEQDLARLVKTNDYRVFVARTHGVPNQIVDAIHELPAGEPWEVLHPWPDSAATVFYVGQPEGRTDHELEAAIRTLLPKLYPGARVDGTQFVHHKTWRYFPHFCSVDLQEGVYDRLEALQGQHRTIYVGGLLGFETVETVVAYSKAAIGVHFPDQR